MTIEDNREWIYDSVKSWLRSGASVVAREKATGAIAGTLLGTILTKNNNTSFDDALNSPRAKVGTTSFDDALKCFRAKVGDTSFDENVNRHWAKVCSTPLDVALNSQRLGHDG